MIFKKKDLEFLKLYALCVDPVSITGRNFQIEKISDNTIRFSQVNDNSYFFTDFNLTENIDYFCYNYPTNSIVQFLNTCSDEDEIEFNDNSIKLGNNSDYQFEKIDFSLSGYEDLFDEAKNADYNLKIKDLQKINNIKSYIGSDRGLDTVALMNNYFVASDKQNATSAIKTENDIKEMLFLSKLSINVLSQVKIDEIDIYLDDKKYVFNLLYTYIIIPQKEYILPNFFDANIKQFYNFDTKAKINKEKFLFALNRINVFAKDNVNSRIYMTFNKDNIVIESKDRGYAIEKIEASIDDELIDHYVILSNNQLLNSVKTIDSNNIIIKSIPSKDPKKATTISIWPENNEDVFVIQNLLRYTDV